MYQEAHSKRKRLRILRNYSINLWGIVIFIAKVFYYTALLFFPFIVVWALGLKLPYPAFVYIGFYVLLAQEFIRHPSHFILRGEPWNQRIFIRKVTYEEERGYDTYSDWLSK
jgi:hypothetical protein